MKKRMISLALSAITAISAVSAMSSNARYYWGSVDEATLEETFKDCVKLEGYEWLGYGNSWEKTQYMYYTPNEYQSTTFYEVYRSRDYLYITVDADENLDEIKEKIQAVDEKLFINPYELTHLDNKYQFAISAAVISPETTKKIREQVGDAASEVKYLYNRHFYRNINCNYVTSYSKDKWYYDYEAEKNVYYDESDKLREYAAAHEDEFQLIEPEEDTEYNGINLEKGMMYLIPKKEVTEAEHIELAKEIYEATGYKPFGVSPESATPSLGGLTLDLTDYLNGDANCDNIQSMADAAAILQAIGNPDKYALSDLGEFNADYAGDGLTADDALAIQKKLAGITE
ncbi:MAG: hypothetical protein J6A57_04970 [Ruminococcus sp.]|nr:hypothetical protein [Ruminococcus sp.]